jgi:hypothetical protein
VMCDTYQLNLLQPEFYKQYLGYPAGLSPRAALLATRLSDQKRVVGSVIVRNDKMSV